MVGYDIQYDVYQLQKRASEDRFIMRKIEIGKEIYKVFAIFDGHGGPFKDKHIVDYCVKYLFNRVFTALSKVNRDEEKVVVNTIQKAFVDFDVEMYSLHVKEELKYGCTCTAVIVDENKRKIYQINVGDSRSIIFSGSTILGETTDHNAKCEKEIARVRKAGGYIIRNRVNGDLAITRAFGDYLYKQNVLGVYDPLHSPVLAFPDINVSNITYPVNIILTSDAPFEVPGITNFTLVHTFNETAIKMKTLLWKEDTVFHKGIAMDVADSFSSTTDDTTVIVVSVK
jgi:serine/threonine protein phosphatase PrpC